MTWITITNKHTQGAKKTRNALKNQDRRFIIVDGITTWIHVKQDFSRWASSMANDYRFTYKALSGDTDFSDVKQARCGLEIKGFMSLRSHTGTCKSCQALRKAETAPNGSEPLKTALDTPQTLTASPSAVSSYNDMTLDQLIGVMESGLEECLAMASSYEEAINAAKGVRDFENQMAELRRQRVGHAEALKAFSNLEG